jgi:hypothetical protein
MKPLPKAARTSHLPRLSKLNFESGRKPTMLYVDRSSLILLKTEAEVVRREIEFGRPNLLALVNSFPSDRVATHIDDYRKVIRSRDWGLENTPLSLEEFLSGYFAAALAFIDVGFNSLKFLNCPQPEKLEEVFYQVEAAEALRGQFGKRSQSGLDAMILQYENALLDILTQHLGSEASDALDALGTPVSPSLAAESVLLDDFKAFRLLFPEPPNEAALHSLTEKDEEVAWQFLRRHCKWSMRVMLFWYQTLPEPSLTEQIASARNSQGNSSKHRSCLVSDLYKQVNTVDMLDINRISDHLTTLNHLNLTLEPSFSFKGGVGLGSSFIFHEALLAGIMSTTSLGDLAARKWALHSSFVRSKHWGGRL